MAIKCVRISCVFIAFSSHLYYLAHWELFQFLLPKIYLLPPLCVCCTDLAVNRNNRKCAVLLPILLASSLFASIPQFLGHLPSRFLRTTKRRLPVRKVPYAASRYLSRNYPAWAKYAPCAYCSINYPLTCPTIHF